MDAQTQTITDQLTHLTNAIADTPLYQLSPIDGDIRVTPVSGAQVLGSPQQNADGSTSIAIGFVTPNDPTIDRYEVWCQQTTPSGQKPYLVASVTSAPATFTISPSQATVVIATVVTVLKNGLRTDFNSSPTVTFNVASSLSVPAASITAGTLQAGVILTSTIAATQVNAGTLNAFNITGSTISGNTISGGTISGTTITGGSLTIVNSNITVSIDGTNYVKVLDTNTGAYTQVLATEVQSASSSATGIVAPGSVTVTKSSGAQQALLDPGTLKMTNLPSANPGAGTKQFWYDPADSNRVKFAP